LLKACIRADQTPKKGGKPGKAFTFTLHHCWVLLEHDEKWRARNQEVPTKSEKSNNSCSPIGDEHVEYDSDDEDKNGRRHGGLKKGDCC
jgi:hypothetical protein